VLGVHGGECRIGLMRDGREVDSAVATQLVVLVVLVGVVLGVFVVLGGSFAGGVADLAVLELLLVSGLLFTAVTDEVALVAAEMAAAGVRAALLTLLLLREQGHRGASGGMGADEARSWLA